MDGEDHAEDIDRHNETFEIEDGNLKDGKEEEYVRCESLIGVKEKNLDGLGGIEVHER